MHTYITHCHQSHKIKIDAAEFFLPMNKKNKAEIPAPEHSYIGVRLRSRPQQISAVGHDVCNIQVRLNLSEKPTLKCASLEWSMMAEMYLFIANRGQSSCFDLSVGLFFRLPSDTWNKHKQVDKHYGNLPKKIGCPSFLSQSAFIVAVNVN